MSWQMSASDEGSERDFAKDVPETCGLALAAFGFVTSYCVRNKFGDRAASALYDKEVGLLTWPGTMHLTSFAMNLRSYLFETSEVRKKFTMPSLYSSAVALLSAQVLQRSAPLRMVVKDAFGANFVYFRFIQWAFTTPAMLHQIVMLSDATAKDEWLIHASNWGMLISGFIGHVVKSKSLAIGALAVSWGCFFSSMRAVHKAFQRAAKAAKALVSYADRMDEARNRSYQDLIKAAERSSAAFSTQNTGGADFTLGSPGSVRPSMSLSPGGGASPALRKTADDEALSEVGDEVGGLDGVRESAHLALTMINRAHWLTVALWPTFGIADFIASAQLLPLRHVENIFSFLDVFSKVLFTSALSLTGQVTQDENDKQMARLAGNKAVDIGRRMRRRSQGERLELEERSQRLANLCQEGWNLVIKDLVNSAMIPEVVIGDEPSDAQPLLPALGVGTGGSRESLEEMWGYRRKSAQDGPVFQVDTGYKY